MTSRISYNLKAFEARSTESPAPEVIPCGRRVFSRPQWDALKAIPVFKSADRRAALAAQETVRFGRRIFDGKSH